MNFHNNDQNANVNDILDQPVWIQMSIVKEKQNITADSMTSHNRDKRDVNGWSWLFGFAVAVTDNMDSRKHDSTINDNSTCTLDVKKNEEQVDDDTMTIRSSPFGQVKLRKTSRSTSSTQPITKTTPSPHHLKTKSYSLRQPKTILIRDQWNRTFNGLKVDLTADEVSQYVVLANTNNQYNEYASSSLSSSLSYTPSNLIELIHLHEPALIKSLKDRYDERKVYTFCGKILLALNPFCQLDGLYSKDTMKRYWNRDGFITCTASSDKKDDNVKNCNNDFSSNGDILEPHVYAIAHEAYSSMMRAFEDIRNVSNNNLLSHEDHNIQIDQSILVSGESGAGKTVTTKIVMQYLASLSEQSNIGNQKNITCQSIQSRSMEQQVLQSNPILESFGNARTIRNDNSSRFGKFIEIQFHRSGRLMGASINTYLLEKVRLIRQAEGERNYHIFYEMLSGLQRSEKRDFGLEGRGVKDFRITACSGTIDRRDGIKDKDTYKTLCNAMQTVGFSSDEQREILQITSGLLHMSNIDFQETKSDSVIIKETVPSLTYVLKNFGVTLDLLQKALCTSTIKVGGQEIIKMLSLEKVQKATEALMKATYSALFDHIVQRVNSSITVGSDNDVTGYTHKQAFQDYAFIKILDIFGFECFAVNSFEQLCINYCNEALQQQFNKYIFKLEQQEYEKENIAWSFISFPDNQDVLDLIETRHTGIFSILDEQCKLAKCTDSSFSRALYEKCSDHSRFGSDRTQKARGYFFVQHYAGIVEYDTASFLDKNKDELPKEATDFLLSSSIPTVAKLGEILSRESNLSMKRNINTSKSLLSRASVGNQFTTQLKELRSNIDLTAPHYIRCIKPNDELFPDNFVPSVVADQLNCAGVLEAVRVSRVGYPQRYTKHMFIQRYWMLGIQALEKAKKYRQDLCEALVDHLVPFVWAEQQKSSDQPETTSSCTFDLVVVGIQLGKTKVFLRHHAFNALEILRSRKQGEASTKIQATYRMYFSKATYKRICHSALVLQCCFRSFIARNKLQYLRESKTAIIIQSAWKGYRKYKTYSNIRYVTAWCQRFHRGNIARARVNEILLDNRAIFIQSWWRMVTVLSRYKALHVIAFNVQQLFRSQKAKRILRQLKLEAKDVSCVTMERDALKEELAFWKAKEETLRSNVTYEEVQSLREEIKRKDQQIIDLKKEKVYSPNTVSHSFTTEKDDELERLKREMCAKDNEITQLKQKIEELQDIAQEKEYMTMRTTRPVNLLDVQSIIKTPSPEHTNELWSPSSSSLQPRCLNFDTPIHTAIRAADDDALSVAVTNAEDISNDINRVGHDGKSPLHLAVLNSNISSAQFLLKNHSVANTQDNDGNTPLHYAESSEMVRLLLETGNANPNIPNEAGVCAIHVVVRRRDVESTKLLINHRVNVNVADDTNWWTPLHLISQPIGDQLSKEEIQSRTIDIAQALLSVQIPSTVEIDYMDKDGNTPLHHAAVLSSHHAGDLISLFLRKNASPNIQNDRGQTALHLVLHNINLRKFDFYNDLVQLLIYHGSTTDIPSLSGCTPLHLALYHQDTRNAIQLVENGAQLHHPWVKPAHWAVHWIDHSSSSEVFPLEMIDDEELRLSIISSIKSKQNQAPTRSNCMFCKKKVGTFSRPRSCRHCGSLVCSPCAPNKLDRSFFPSYCDIEDEGRVCLLCESVLISRKRDENIMGREVYAIHCKQEDVSYLDMDASHLDESNGPCIQMEM